MGDVASTAIGLLIILLLMVQGAAAEYENGDGRPWWKENWAVRKDHAVDGIALILQALIVTKELSRQWLEEPDGMARGLWRPNRKFYQLFTRAMHFLSAAQEVLFLQLEHTGVRKKCRI